MLRNAATVLGIAAVFGDARRRAGLG